MQLQLRTLGLRLRRWLLLLAEGFFLVSLLGVLLFRLVPPPFTWLMVKRRLEGDSPRHALLWGRYVPLAEMPKSLQRAVIASEDQKFATHVGFDFEAIWKVMQMNAYSQKLRGASTISQQTAKNVFLWPTRNFLRKGLEAWFTVWIELYWPKQRILELYLNCIETGPGLYGAEAWSQHYFKKSVRELNVWEAALLAACLPNPRRWHPGAIRPFLRQKQGWILWQMQFMELP
jgi:monofunctional biosynthetic peptidoglycan transglycosylase